MENLWQIYRDRGVQVLVIVIRFYTLLDTSDFDAELVKLRGVLDELLAGDG